MDNRLPLLFQLGSREMAVLLHQNFSRIWHILMHFYAMFVVTGLPVQTLD